jgi:hypothetical protein
MIVINLGAYVKAPTMPTDPDYESRCLKFDAERAWKMREPLEKALSWPKGSVQYGVWMDAYTKAKEAE